MSQDLIKRVKISLNKQSYTMNDSWLTDCIEYYLDDHVNPMQDEITTFVINQWQLSDLREINNENGCLPRNLAQQKCTTLTGKYNLQMDKIYDISTSKYKQLEKIRNVSSENVEATENENVAQEDKFQAWEPKSKRMLQLSLTDGIQDVLAIEYKPIRFLKDNLLPGYKLAIKGPVICRRGVLLLEETNIAEIGGEVDSLLIVNAVENIFARALNLEENPDPYGDNNKQANTQNTQTTQQTIQIEDDFDMDSEMIDQIDKQIEQQNSSNNVNTIRTIVRSEQKQIFESRNNTNNSQGSTFITNEPHNSITSVSRNQQSNSGNFCSSATKVQKQNYNNIESKTSQFGDDEVDAILEMIDENAIANLPTSKIGTGQKSTSFNVSEEKSPFFNTSKLQSESVKKSNFSSKTSIESVTSNKKNFNENVKLEHKNTRLKNIPKENNSDDSSCKKNSMWNVPSLQQRVTENIKPSTSSASDFPDDDFDINDCDINTDNGHKNDKKQITKQAVSNNSSRLQTSNTKVESLSCQSNKNLTDEKSDCNSLEHFDNNKFEIEIELESKMENVCKVEKQEEIFDNKKLKIEKKSETLINTMNSTDCGSAEVSGMKRLASTISPFKDAPQKIRCIQNTPTDKTKNRKITDFLRKSQSNKDENNYSLLNEHLPKIYEFIKEVLENLSDSGTHTVVRGKVTNIVKLDLFKTEKGPYYHLEGTITDHTAKLDVVFSSKVLEKVIGFSPEEFCQKRKQSRTNPSIKDQLREDLRKAQHALRYMDVYMEIKLKNKGEKAMVLNIMEMKKEQKRDIDLRLQVYLAGI